MTITRQQRLSNAVTSSAKPRLRLLAFPVVISWTTCKHGRRFKGRGRGALSVALHRRIALVHDNSCLKIIRFQTSPQLTAKNLKFAKFSASLWRWVRADNGPVGHAVTSVMSHCSMSHRGQGSVDNFPFMTLMLNKEQETLLSLTYRASAAGAHTVA